MTITLTEAEHDRVARAVLDRTEVDGVSTDQLATKPEVDGIVFVVLMEINRILAERATASKAAWLAEHAEEMQWEYATTTGPRKAWSSYDAPPDSRPGWEKDLSKGREGVAWERFDYHEEAYWKRRKDAPSAPAPAPSNPQDR